MARPVENIRILEVADTNLLKVVTSNETDATYYSKSNLEVSALDGRLVIKNEGSVILSAFPYEVLEPQEESVVDLTRIVKSYIDNVIPENKEEVDVLKNILSSNNERNTILTLIREQGDSNQKILEEMKLCVKYLRKIYSSD